MYKVRFVLMRCLIFLMAAVCCVSCAKSAKDAWQQQYDLGVQYLGNGDYEQAVIAFEAAIEIDPKRMEAYSGAAQAYVALDDIEAAIAALQEGYAATGAAELQQEAEKLDRGLHVVYEATVVDGIYHHPYLDYELPDEVQTLFDTLIAYTEAGRYEECAEMLKDWDELEHILLTQCNYQSSSARVAYKGYKISVNPFDVSLIPISDGMGAIYSYDSSDYGYFEQEFHATEETIKYTCCECHDGMFNGSFIANRITRVQKIDYVGVSITEGKVTNGLIDGRVTTYYDNPVFNWPEYGQMSHDVGSYYSIFSNGKIDKYEVVEGELSGEKGYWVTYIFREDGTFYTSVWEDSVEGVETEISQIHWISSYGAAVGGYGKESGTPDGVHVIYPY